LPSQKGYVEQLQERIKCLKAVTQERGPPWKVCPRSRIPRRSPPQLSLSLQAPPLAIIHSLLLLIVFSLHSSAAVSSWHLIGVAVEKCIALGFHRETGKLGGSGGGIGQGVGGEQVGVLVLLFAGYVSDWSLFKAGVWLPHTRCRFLHAIDSIP
jgi:hypothetical protein